MQLQLQEWFCSLGLASVVSKQPLVLCCILLNTTQSHLPARVSLIDFLMEEIPQVPQSAECPFMSISV